MLLCCLGKNEFPSIVHAVVFSLLIRALVISGQLLKFRQEAQFASCLDFVLFLVRVNFSEAVHVQLVCGLEINPLRSAALWFGTVV